MYFTALLRTQFGSPSGAIGKHLIAPLMNVANLRQIRLSIQLLGLQSSDVALDVGFGSGMSLVMLSRQANTVIGIDYSRDMVEDATALVRRRGLESRVSVRCGDVARMPLPDRSVDKILSSNSLYYWADIRTSLRELKRVLRPGGKVALGFRSATCLRPFEFAWRGFHVYEPQEMATLLRDAGFEIVHVEHRDWWRVPDLVVVVAQLPLLTTSL